jgi:hypothetical protein
MIARLLDWLRRKLGSPTRSEQAHSGLTEIEYEAVSLIAYEGRHACARAREQVEFCRKHGSSRGVLFWSRVAIEVERRTGRPKQVQQ